MAGPRVRRLRQPGRIGNGALVALALVLACAVAAGRGTQADERVAELAALERQLYGEDDRTVLDAMDRLIELLHDLSPDQVDYGPQDAALAGAYSRAVSVVLAQPERYWADELDPETEFVKACEAAEAVGSLELRAYTGLGLGKFLTETGRYAEAVDVLAQTVETSPNSGQVPWLRLALAQVRRQRGELAEAMDEVERAEAFRRRIADSWAYHDQLRCEILGQRIECCLRLGVLDEAVRSLREGEELLARVGHPVLRANYTLHRMQVLAAQERYRTLERFAEERLEGLDLRATAYNAAQVRLMLAVARAVQGRTDEALARRARAELDALRDDEALYAEDLLQVDAWRLHLALQGGEDEDAHRCAGDLAARTQPGSGADVPAAQRQLGWIAALRTRYLRRLAGVPRETLAQQRVELERAFHAMLDRWSDLPVRDTGTGFLRYGNRRSVLSELVDVALELDGEAGPRLAFEYVHAAQAQGSAARGAAYEPAPFGTVADLFTEDGGGCVLYMPGPERGHAFVLDATGLTHHVLAPVDHLREAARRLVNEVSAPPQRDSLDAYAATDTAPALRDALLPGALLERVRCWNGATVIASDLIGYVPFEVLPAGDGLLGEELALAYLPTIPRGVLLAATAPPRVPPRTAVLLAATRFGDALKAKHAKVSDIPYGPDQRAQLVGAWDAERVLAIEGEDARREVLSDEALAAADVLVWLTHGLYDAERTRGAGLALFGSGDDLGEVWYEDIEPLRVPPVVVLAACGTARGPFRPGEDGVDNLSGAFFAAGARVVLVSPNKLEYRALLDLLEVFTRELAAGAPAAEALRRARAELARDPERNHPYYALIHVVGVDG